MGGNVPLSEHEQRQLEQIEQALYADYPRFAHAVRASDPRVHYKRRVVEAAFGFLLGIGMLLGGVVSTYIWIGVAGFVVMLACAMWALTSWRHMTGTAASSSAAAGRGGPRGRAARDRRGPRDRRGGRAHRAGMMERLEERWRRRQERDR
jgi:Na+/proline symporter